MRDVKGCGDVACVLRLVGIDLMWVGVPELGFVVLIDVFVSCLLREVTYVSSLPAKTYLRCDRASDSASSWVFLSVGMRPW